MSFDCVVGDASVWGVVVGATQDLVVDMPLTGRQPQDVGGLQQSNYAGVNGSAPIAGGTAPGPG
jgi:hypothetical protein